MGQSIENTYKPTSQEEFITLIDPMIGKGSFKIERGSEITIKGFAEHGDLNLEINATIEILDNLEVCLLYGYLLNILDIEAGSLTIMKHKDSRIIIMQSASEER